MKWTNVRLIFQREVRDQLRDRRTLFTIAVLPLLLYPLLGIVFFQIAQFMREHHTTILVLGTDALPAEPALLENASFSPVLVAPLDVGRLQLTLRPLNSSGKENVREEAERLVQGGQFDAVVVFPRDFATRLNEFREQLREKTHETRGMHGIPQPEVFVNTANDKSRIAAERLERVLGRWREAIVSDNLRRQNVPVAATEPFRLLNTDVAKERSRRAAAWSKILPFVVLIWALTGAFYPAIDLCAGEKERGTLETLLCSPAQRGEIVWGKLLTITLFSMATSIFNLLCMALTSIFVISRITQMEGGLAGAPIGIPPWTALSWLLLALIPISALFSALALAIAAFARSSKEGQYYLMPLLLVTLPLMMLPMLPTAELDLGTSLIPVTGVMLLLRALIEEQYVAALRYAVPVVGVTCLCCLLAIRWAIGQFSDESVLFRESERWGLGLWLKQVVRDRGETPSVAEALLCGVLILLVRFFASFSLGAPESWPQFAMTTVVSQLAFIATPALLMAIILTRSVGQTLLLRPPRLTSVPAALLLAVAIHPAGMALTEAIQRLYPIGADVLQQLQQMGGLVHQAPNVWSVLVVLALTPAICEELAYRGFILSGLRRSGHKWVAIIVSSLFFGITHGVLQQSLAAFALGIVLGYLAVQTGSLLPGLLFHAVYNSLGLVLSLTAVNGLNRSPAVDWLLRDPASSPGYRWPVVAASVLVSLLILAWFRALPFQPTEEERLQEALARGERLAETPDAS